MVMAAMCGQASCGGQSSGGGGDSHRNNAKWRNGSWRKMAKIMRNNSNMAICNPELRNHGVFMKIKITAAGGVRENKKRGISSDGAWRVKRRRRAWRSRLRRKQRRQCARPPRAMRMAGDAAAGAAHKQK